MWGSSGVAGHSKDSMKILWGCWGWALFGDGCVGHSRDSVGILWAWDTVGLALIEVSGTSEALCKISGTLKILWGLGTPGALWG